MSVDERFRNIEELRRRVTEAAERRRTAAAGAGSFHRVRHDVPAGERRGGNRLEAALHVRPDLAAPTDGGEYGVEAIRGRLDRLERKAPE